MVSIVLAGLIVMFVLVEYPDPRLQYGTAKENWKKRKIFASSLTYRVTWKDSPVGVLHWLQKWFLTGKRFCVSSTIKHNFREAKSLIYNLDNNSEPVMYNGEIEDSNSNYFVLRLADHAQFYAFNNKTDKVVQTVAVFMLTCFLGGRVPV